eukprot:413567_1
MSSSYILYNCWLFTICILINQCYSGTSKRDKMCAVGSTNSALDGTYEWLYWNENINGSIYHNAAINKYLYPIIDSTIYYYRISDTIGHSTTVDAYCQIDNIQSPHMFDVKDCYKKWSDSNMIIVSCQDVCISGHDVYSHLDGTYVWYRFYDSGFTHTAVYGLTTVNNVYLYGNIHLNAYQWQIAGDFTSPTCTSYCSVANNVSSDYIFDIEDCVSTGTGNWHTYGSTGTPLVDTMTLQKCNYPATATPTTSSPTTSKPTANPTTTPTTATPTIVTPITSSTMDFSTTNNLASTLLGTTTTTMSTDSKTTSNAIAIDFITVIITFDTLLTQHDITIILTDLEKITNTFINESNINEDCIKSLKYDTRQEYSKTTINITFTICNETAKSNLLSVIDHNIFKRSVMDSIENMKLSVEIDSNDISVDVIDDDTVIWIETTTYEFAINVNDDNTWIIIVVLFAIMLFVGTIIICVVLITQIKKTNKVLKNDVPMRVIPLTSDICVKSNIVKNIEGSRPISGGKSNSVKHSEMQSGNINDEIIITSDSDEENHKNTSGNIEKRNAYNEQNNNDKNMIVNDEYANEGNMKDDDSLNIGVKKQLPPQPILNSAVQLALPVQMETNIRNNVCVEMIEGK